MTIYGKGHCSRTKIPITKFCREEGGGGRDREPQKHINIQRERAINSLQRDRERERERPFLLYLALDCNSSHVAILLLISAVDKH